VRRVESRGGEEENYNLIWTVVFSPSSAFVASNIWTVNTLWEENV
jgi:hypothetical protein